MLRRKSLNPSTQDGINTASKCTVATAAKEKQAIADAYHWYKKDFETSYAWIWILHNVEIATSACRKDPTQENALALCEVLEGRMKDLGEAENAIAQRYKRLMESMGREVM